MNATPTGLTVLYDADCGICRTARRWLASQPQLVPLEFLPAGSAEARRRYPALDHGQTLVDITVVGVDGSVYSADAAWVICLWALADFRGAAARLAAHPGLARRMVSAASAVRGKRDGYRADCAENCRT